MTVLATAGHVDHGKSTLVNFLTEQETDRLTEEKTRGLTINLGYTFYEYEDKIISIVDVPGHRDFFKNTIAGFSNADAILFVIDSTQGWSEQSEQHFRALTGLSKMNIMFIYTKLDLPESSIDEDFLIDKVSEIKNLNYTILKFHKETTSKESLLKDIQSFLSSVSNNYSSFWVDRSFIIDGIGRIVTGTAGVNFKVNNSLLTQGGKKIDIKSIESTNKKYTEETGSQRIALSLKKSNETAPKRGDLLSEDLLRVSDHIFLEINPENANSIKNNTIKLFVGTTNKLVHKLYLLKVGNKIYAIAKLNEPVSMPAGEKMVLHDVDNNNFFGCEFIMPVMNHNLVKHLINKSKNGSEHETLNDLLFFSPIKSSDQALKLGSLYIDDSNLESIHRHIKDNIEKINKFGIAKYLYDRFFIEEEEIGNIFIAFDDIYINDNQIKFVEEDTQEDRKVLDLIKKELGSELSVPNIDLQQFDREIVKNLFLVGKLIRVSKNILYTDQHFSRVLNIIKELPDVFTIAEFKSASSLSRKYTIPLLEILDDKQITKKIDTEGSRKKLFS